MADFHNVDLVTNRNSLRHLLGFVRGKAKSSFRIDLNIVHNTLVMTRREKSTREFIGKNQKSGFGHTFEHAFTESDPNMRSSGHHRVIRYTLGNLKCVVRFEVDAWYDDNAEPTASETHVLSMEGKSDNISDSLANLSMSGGRKRSTVVLHDGCLVPCSATVEFRTKSKSRNPVMGK